MASNAIDTCSPVDSSTSISRAAGSRAMPAARSTRRSVESPIAETTTAMRSPRARTAATFSATRWMSSTEPTEVPPYFWTIVLPDALTRRVWCARTLRRFATRAGSAAGLLPPACAKSGRPPPLPPTWPATLPTSSPAFTLPVWSAVTPATSVILLVASTEASTMTADLSLSLSWSTALRSAPASAPSTCAATSFTPAMSVRARPKDPCPARSRACS